MSYGKRTQVMDDLPSRFLTTIGVALFITDALIAKRIATAQELAEHARALSRRTPNVPAYDDVTLVLDVLALALTDENRDYLRRKLAGPSRRAA